MARRSLRHVSHHLDRRLKFRLTLYFLITLALLGFFAFNIFRGALSFGFGTAGILIGIFIGIIVSRMFHISWNKDAKKVVGRLDLYGVIILILYVVFEFYRERIVGYFTHDLQAATISFAVLTGIMIGRILGTRGRILKVLREQELI